MTGRTYEAGHRATVRLTESSAWAATRLLRMSDVDAENLSELVNEALDAYWLHHHLAGQPRQTRPV